jgi:hypothetical protein
MALGAIVARITSVIGVIALVPLGVMALMALTQQLIRWTDIRSPQKRVLNWALASFAIHLVVGAAIASSSSIVSYLGPDAATYNDGARAILNHWTHGLPMPSFSAGKEGYYFLLAGLYWIFGASVWAGIALNALLAALMVPIVTDSTHRLFGPAAARYSPALMVIVPGMAIWPAQLLKEAPFLFLLAVASNCAIRLSKRFTLPPLALLAFTLPLLLTIRSQMGLALIGGLVVGIMLSREHISGGVVGAAAITLLMGTVLSLGLGSSGYNTAVNVNLKQANDVRNGLASTAKSGFQTDTDISTVQRAASFLPQGLVIVAVGPFPWQLHGGRQLVALPDTVAWWALGVTLWWGQRAARRMNGRKLLVVVIPALASMAVLALVIGNYGILVRERMQVLVLLAPLMALGLATRRVGQETDAELALAA